MSLRKLVSVGSLVVVCMALTCMGQGTGTIRYEVWEGIGTVNVEELRASPDFPENPTWDDEVTLFETPTDIGDNFGGRLYGWLHPDADADYTFWIAADDHAELWLSTTDSADDAALIAFEDGWGPSREWRTGNNMSDPVPLVGGEKYYIEALYKEAGGGDNLAVAWNTSTDMNDLVPIDGAFLSPAPRQPSMFKARNVGPADGAVDVAPDTTLEWIAGPTALLHQVYLSTDATIDEADLQGDIAETSLAVSLEPGTKYYWRVDEVDMDGTHEGHLWSFTTIPLEAHFPSPAAGAAWQAQDTQLSWVPGLGALVHNVFFSTDQALVEAKDPSVQVGQWLSEATFDPGALEPGTKYFWAVDEFLGTSTNAGPVWSFTTADPTIEMNITSWNGKAAAAEPGYQALHVANGVYDIGDFSGDITYEFVVNSNPDETQASMALIGEMFNNRAGIKYEQWNNTGTYGATLFGVVDLDFGVPTAPGENTHLAFVSSEDAATTTLYVNGAEAASVDRAITLNGIVGLGRAIRDAEGAGWVDDFDGAIYGVAIYDRALSAADIDKNATAFSTPMEITDPNLVLHYTMDDASGGILIDQSGHGNFGTLVGDPQLVAVDGRTALELDGDGDFVDAGNSADFDIPVNITVAAWINVAQFDKNWQAIVTKGDTSWRLHRSSGSSNIAWGTQDVAPTDLTSTVAVDDGEWHHAAAVYDGAQKLLYIDGVLDAASDSTGSIRSTTHNVNIGENNQAQGRYLTGLVDDVRIYNKALSEADVVAVMLGISDVTGPDDVVQGVPNDGDWPGGEHPALMIDDNVGTKYLHFKGDELASGIQIQPALGATIVNGLTLTAANDCAGRDPISFELYGSNDGIDGPYELIANGDVVDFAGADEWPRFAKTATPIIFENDVAYTNYQILFPAIRGPVGACVNSMQIAEVELLGQAVLYAQDFDSLAAGTDLHTVDGWEGWDGDANAGAPVSDAFALSGANSLEIPGSADLIKLFDLAGGVVTLSVMQYIPSGTTGTTYFILMNQYPDNKDWSIQTTFDLAAGTIGFWHGGAATIVYDEWIELKYVIDLDNNTVDKYYDGAYVVTDTWDDNAHGTLQAIDLFGNGASSVYYDDLRVD